MARSAGSTLMTAAEGVPDSTARSRYGTVAMPSKFVLTVRASASAWLPLAAAVSATPTPNVVGTTQKMASPTANSCGRSGSRRAAKPSMGVTPRMASSPNVGARQSLVAALKSLRLSVKPLTRKTAALLAACTARTSAIRPLPTARPGSGQVSETSTASAKPSGKKLATTKAETRGPCRARAATSAAQVRPNAVAAEARSGCTASGACASTASASRPRSTAALAPSGAESSSERGARPCSAAHAAAPALVSHVISAALPPLRLLQALGSGRARYAARKSLPAVASPKRGPYAHRKAASQRIKRATR
jgi:hypothetical protein